MIEFASLSTPLGLLELQGSEGKVIAIQFVAEARPEAGPSYLQEAAAQIGAYFAGARRDFDFPLAPKGTAFQMRVWDALREIPYGQTATYGQIADRLGKRKAARAVGAAAGKNPCLLAVPCHRLIGVKGLTGFAAGLDRKEYLLNLEQGKNL